MLRATSAEPQIVRTTLLIAMDSVMNVIESIPQFETESESSGLSRRKVMKMGKRVEQIIQFATENYPEKYRDTIIKVLLDQIVVRQELLNEMSEWQQAKIKEKQ